MLTAATWKEGAAERGCGAGSASRAAGTVLSAAFPLSGCAPQVWDGVAGEQRCPHSSPLPAGLFAFPLGRSSHLAACRQAVCCCTGCARSKFGSHDHFVPEGPKPGVSPGTSTHALSVRGCCFISSSCSHPVPCLLWESGLALPSLDSFIFLREGIKVKKVFCGN